MNSPWWKRISIELLFIFLISLTPLLWFRQGTLFVGHDDTYPVDAKPFIVNRLFTWTESSFGYDQSLIMGTLAIHGVDVLPTLFGFSGQTAQKIVYVYWFFMIGISIYVLAHTLEPTNSSFKLVAVLLYQFNFFLLQAWWIAEKSKFSAYIALPLLLALFIWVYRDKLSVLRAASLGSVVLFFFNGGGIFGMPLFGGVLISIASFLLLFSFIGLKEKKFHQISNIWALTAALCVGYVFVNAYFLFPAVPKLQESFLQGVSQNGGVSGILDWAREVSRNTSYMNLFRLQGVPDWYDTIDHPYAASYLTNPILITGSYVWSLLVFLSLLSIRKYRDPLILILFLFIYLVGIFFASGAHPPFGFIYEWMLSHLPGFVVFRTPYYKFAPAVYLGSAFLISYLFTLTSGKIRKVQFAILVMFIFAYHFPYFVGEFFSFRTVMSTRLSIPSYVYDFEHWIQKDKTDSSRVLLLPENSPEWLYEMYEWRYLSLTPLAEMFGTNGIVANTIRLQPNQKILVDQLYKGLRDRRLDDVNHLVKELNIGYFLVRRDAAWNLPWASVTSPQQYVDRITSIPGVIKSRSFGPWELYVLPHDQQSRFMSINAFDVVDVQDEKKNIPDFSSFPIKPSYYITSADYDRLSRIENIPTGTIYEVPACFSCRYFFTINVQFPQRDVQSESFLYPLIQLQELRQINRAVSSKDRLFVYMGLTLKRIGEIRTIQDKHLKGMSKTLQYLFGELSTISDLFAEIHDPLERIQVASELLVYLTKEQQYLEQFYGRTVVDVADVEKLQSVLTKINEIVIAITPFAFNVHPTTQRIYLVSPPAAGPYQIWVNKNEYDSLKELFSLSLDGAKLPLEPAKPTSDWLPLGSTEMSTGVHQLLMEASEPPNLLGQFSPSQSPPVGQATCVESQIDLNHPDGLYRFYISINDDALRDILVVIQKYDRNASASEYAFSPFLQTGTRDFIGSLENIENLQKIVIQLCDKELSKEVVANNISISVQKIKEYPFVFVKPSELTFGQSLVQYNQINSTQYVVSMIDDRFPMLIFDQSYDSQWKLVPRSLVRSGPVGFLDLFTHSGVLDAQHVRVNNTANGWLRADTSEHEFILLYYPQLFFIVGCFVSGTTLLVCAIVIARKSRRSS